MMLTIGTDDDGTELIRILHEDTQNGRVKPKDIWTPPDGPWEGDASHYMDETVRSIVFGNTMIEWNVQRDVDEEETSAAPQ